MDAQRGANIVQYTVFKTFYKKSEMCWVHLNLNLPSLLESPLVAISTTSLLRSVATSFAHLLQSMFRVVAL